MKPSVRATTYLDYRNTIRKHAIPALGSLKLAAVQPAHVQQMQAQMQALGLSPKTIRNAHGTLHSALEQAVDWNLAARNVVALVRPPAAKRTEIQALTPDQVKTLLQTADGTRWHALLMLAVTTGMRQGELLGLRWSDVVLDSGVLHVRRQLTRQKTYTEPKTAHGRRTVHLARSAVSALREHRARQLEERLIAGQGWEDNDLVFCTYRGRSLIARNVVKDFANILERAGVPHVPFHALRHTAATLMLTQEVPVKIVQEMLGHSQVSVTLDIYSHVTPAMGRLAADRLERLLA